MKAKSKERGGLGGRLSGGWEVSTRKGEMQKQGKMEKGGKSTFESTASHLPKARTF